MPPPGGRRGGRLAQGFFQAINGAQDLLLETDQCGACLPERAILLGETANASALLHRKTAHARATGFTPGKHGSGMTPATRLGAVATRVAAASLHLVNGAFEQFTDAENLPQLTAILGGQIAQDLPLAVSGIGNRDGRALGFHICS